MARLPGTQSNILDGNLNPVAPPTNLDQSVLIIGTAYDGPMYEPIVVTSPDNAELLYGPEGNATLVKGIKEAWNASEGTPNIRAVRIGNGRTASLEIEEKTGTGVEAATTGQAALKLTARFPGSKYNIVSIRLNDSLDVEVTYPDPDDQGATTTSVFKYNLSASASSDSIKNVMDLANAINADPKLGRVVLAEVIPMTASFEIKIKESDTGVTTGGGLTLDLSAILADGSTVLDPAYVTGDSPSPNPIATAGNRIYSLDEVYALSNSGEEVLEVAGKASIFAELPIVDGKTNSNYNSIQALKDWDGTEDYWVGPSGYGAITEFYQSVDAQTFNGVANGVVDEDEDQYSFTTYLAPDNGTSIDDQSNQLAVTYGASYAQSGSAFATYSVPVTSMKRSNARKIKLEYKLAGSNSWAELPYADASGNALWSISYTGAPSATSSATVTVASGTLDPGIKGFPVGTQLQITYDSIIGQLFEQVTLTAAQSTENWTNYFVRGSEIVFGDPVPSNIGVRYGTLVNYEPGTNVTLDDSQNGIVRFTDPELQPGPGGSGLAASGTVIGFTYQYLPEWLNLNKSAKSLAGGTNGVNLTTNSLYSELETAYDNLKNYPVDIIVPMGAYLDATKITYNPITGQKQTENAGYHTQLSSFLTSLEKDVNETIGIISVLPPNSTSQADVASWVTECTTVDLADPTRAANLMAALGDKNINVLAFYPFGGSTGCAPYAGYIASLPPHISTTNKIIGGIYPSFTLSRSQNEAMLDYRYVTMKGNRKITEGLTAAAPGSDYELLTTVRITYAAMDVVREVADPFIGKPNTVQNRNAMDAAIQRGLQAMVEAGALRRYDFSIKSDPNQQVLGIVNIDMTLVPVFEIRYVNVTVKLRQS